jgi:hypothetical protein
MDNRQYSKRQETRAAKALSGKRTANSGASTFDKGDVRAKELLVECKTLSKQQASHTIKKEWLTKAYDEAIARGLHFSALCFDFGDGSNYYVLSERDFTELYNVWLHQTSGEEV